MSRAQGICGWNCAVLDERVSFIPMAGPWRNLLGDLEQLWHAFCLHSLVSTD